MKSKAINFWGHNEAYPRNIRR